MFFSKASKVEIYGDSEVSSLDGAFMKIGTEKFSTWKILREGGLDGGASTNFGTIDLLKNMET